MPTIPWQGTVLLATLKTGAGAALLDRGVLVSESTRAPLRLALTAALASRWMPGLFLERAS